MKINPKEALQKLTEIESPFLTVFEHGTLSLEVYKPEQVDLQQPHSRDEVYVIISGNGEFVNDGMRSQVNVGDFLFVPAGIKHRFENFTEDFSTWVIFYGPEGGENGTRAYQQHYLHLWTNENSSPYIESSFTRAILELEEDDKNTILYRILSNKKTVGVLKISLNAALAPYSEKEALCIDKIYILKEHSGKGIGKKVLQFVQLRAQEMHKKVVWLDTMQKGPALDFYIKNGFEIHSKGMVTFPAVLEDERLMWVMVKKCSVLDAKS